jgi:hypothetical protein
MNSIRNHLNRRNRRIHDVICDENQYFAKNSWFLRKKMTKRSKIFRKS